MIRAISAALALFAVPANAQVISPLYPAVSTDTSALATKAEVAAVSASIPSTAGLATTASVAAMAATIPAPASSAPPAIVDNNSGVLGTAGFYALATHTHPSKARKGRAQSTSAGVLDVTFSPVFTGTPVCAVTAETTSGDTGVVNAQIDGPTSTTAARFRVTRTAITTVSLIGLNVLSVPASPGVTWVHYLCLEP